MTHYETCIHSRRRKNSRAVKADCPSGKPDKKSFAVANTELCEHCPAWRDVGNLFPHPVDTEDTCARCGEGFASGDEEGVDYHVSQTKRGGTFYAHVACLYQKEDL